MNLLFRLTGSFVLYSKRTEKGRFKFVFTQDGKSGKEKTHESTQLAAITYSFLGTCALINIDPYSWLKETLEKIPDNKNLNLKELLPG